MLLWLSRPTPPTPHGEGLMRERGRPRFTPLHSAIAGEEHLQITPPLRFYAAKLLCE
jgi:hypothetical protein